MPVSITDWNTGNMYDGTIEQIDDYPSDSGGYYGYGAAASYYPFRVKVDGTADLEEGSWVNVSYTPESTGGSGVYLDNMFLRSRDGLHYIYVQGEDGKLEERQVSVGRNLWGSYTELLSGWNGDEYIAFPYGKNVKAGADTRVAETDELWS